jgi:hypothetical protein
LAPPTAPPVFEPFHPSLVLAAYAEALIGGGRVAVFGDATIGIAAELCKRGARLVHVYDTDAGRAAEASAQNRNRSIYYAPLSETGDIGVKDGAFDCAIVADLSLAGDPAALLELVRRVVSSSGAALIASPNVDAPAQLVGVAHGAAPLGYYDLYEAVSAKFPTVRMIGQAPFVGYAVAEFSADGDPEPTIDSSLVRTEGKEPDWFIALASERWVRVDPFCLVEIPARPAPGEATAAPAVSAASAAAEKELAAARITLRDQEQAIAQERKRLEQANAQATAAREELSLVRGRAENLARALEQEEQRRAGLDRTLEQEEQRRAALDRTLEQHEKRRKDLETELATSRTALEAARTALEAARKDPELGRLRARVADLEKSIEQAAAPHEAEVGRLEQLLAERGAEILDLRREVDRRELLVREILSELPAAAASAPDQVPAAQPAAAQAPPAAADAPAPAGEAADLRLRLDRLAAEVARREADLLAASWKIAMFERNTGTPTENDR